MPNHPKLGVFGLVCAGLVIANNSELRISGSLFAIIGRINVANDTELGIFKGLSRH